MKTTMKLVILDPGHFHAALLQKTMYANVDATVATIESDAPDLRGIPITKSQLAQR